jgi:GAF domain-containing protein
MVESATLLRQQESLREIIESISSELELRPLLTLIVRRACDLLHADNGTIGLVDEQRNIVRTEAAYRMPLDELGAESPPGVGLFGHILAHCAPIILTRYGDVHRPTQLAYLDHSVIGVPIFWRTRLIGVFGLGSPPPRCFTEQDVDVLSLFARHAAIAIVNAQLFALQQRRTQRSAIINQIGRQITSSLELPLLLQRTVEALDAHLHYSNVALLLVDPDDPEMLVLRARSGVYAVNAPSDYRQSSHAGVIGAAAQSRRPILIPDVNHDPRYIRVAGVHNIQAELAMPLVAHERLIGVLNIESTQPIPDDIVADLGIIADQLSVAIENAQRYEEERRRTQRLELIARVGQRIAARLDPDDLFTATIQELFTQLGYDHVAFFVLDQTDPEWLEQRAFASLWPDAGRIGYRQSIGQGILGLAARQRTPALVNNVNADRRYIPVSDTAELRAELAVPILLGERLLGVLDVGSRKPFVEDDVRAIQIIADQLAVAIEHSALFADTQRALTETEMLYQTSQRISVALDVGDVVLSYLEQVAARGRYACTVALYEFDLYGDRVAVVVYGRWTPTEGLQCPLQVRIPYVHDALDAPLDAGETVMITNILTDGRVSEELRQLQVADRRPALALIPLIVRGVRIGLVILSYPAVHEWRPAHLHPYQITAAQLATAIDSRQQQALVAKRDQGLAIFEERRRLARELHDSVTQLLFSITLIAQSIGPAWRRNPAEGEQRIGRLLELSQGALTEMRALLVELRPPEQVVQAELEQLAPLSTRVQVQRMGLIKALETHIQTLRQEHLTISLMADEYHPQGVNHEEAFFRIAQESLNNIIKHAQATQVAIAVAATPSEVRLVVCDNGVGFALETPVTPTLSAHQGGLGLQTMRERATAIHGVLTITTAPGQGTRVEVVAATSGRS